MSVSSAFTKVPNDVLLDPTMTAGCRVAYGVLRHLAWKAGRREEQDEVTLPPLEQVAQAVGCSRSTVATYVAEMRRRGLIATRRRGNRGMLYQVFDQPSYSPKSGLVEVRNPDYTAPASISGPKITPEDKNFPPTPRDLTQPPRHVVIDGRNVPLDALVEECGIDPDPSNHRMTLAVLALNGRGRPKEPGIREAFWAECVRQAHARFPDGADSVLADLHDDPHNFAVLLADRIRHKADRYRSAFPGLTMTPKALRDWWFDVETQTGGALTSSDLERLAGG